VTPGVAAVSSPTSTRAAWTRGDLLFRVALVAGCLVLFLAGTAALSVFDRDEARFALAVKEMMARGDLLVPSNFGEPRYNKPILIYWLAIAAARAIGLGELAVRLPSALCSIVTVLVTMAIARRLRGERVARIAGCAIATALFFVVEARVMTADAALVASTTISFWAWLRLRDRPQAPARWQLAFWAGVGLGLLAKVVNVAFLAAAGAALGVMQAWTSWSRRARLALAATIGVGAIAVAIPHLGFVGPTALGAIALVLFVASLKSPAARAEWRLLGWPWGAPLALAMFAAWGIPAALRTHGGFVSQGVGDHLLGRTVTPFEGHFGPPGYYLVTTLVAFFPWGAMLPAAIAAAWSARRRDPRIAFLLAWVIGPLVLVELTTSKLPHYMLVSFPAMAILVALMLVARMDGVETVSRRVRVFEAIVFALPCAVVAAAGVWVAAKYDAAEMRRAGILLAAVALVAGGAGVALGLRARARTQLGAFVAGAAALVVTTFAIFLPALEPLRLSPRLGAVVAQNLAEHERLALAKLDEASVGYYLPRTPDAVGSFEEVSTLLRTTRDDVLVILPGDDDGRFLARLQSGDSARWERVATVRGVILPDLRERVAWLERRHAPGADRAR
jgi:4-amino-4-deoxy-L-arabinose transferase-like glycosyltransferase